MTDEITYCIRGCVAPCECGACRECAQPIHPPGRRQAETGLLCERCAKTLTRWLGEIPDLYATLNPYEAPATEEHERTGKRAKLSGSPSLVRLDVVALQDARTGVCDRVSRDGSVEHDDGLMDVAGIVCSWAAMFAEEHGITSHVGTITEACGLLRTWMWSLASCLWVDECYDEIRDIVRALNRAHGIPRPMPIGRCINIYERGGHQIACGRMLYAPTSGAKIACTGCGRRYDGYGIIALGKTLEATNGRGA